MKPDWETKDGRIRLFCCDCKTVLEELKAGGGLAIVTDPPYGIKYIFHGGGDGSRGGKYRSTLVRSEPITGDDKEFDPAPFLKIGPCLFWGANYFSNLLPKGGWLVWDKREREVSLSQSDAEIAWCSIEQPCRIFRHRWDGFIKGPETGQERHHPTQKPVALMTWCIEKMNAEAILDPYMGSGTCAVACIRTGRRFIGIEIERKYFNIAVARVKAALVEEQGGPLFAQGGLWNI